VTQIDDKALEAAVLAHDKEEAAMRGEPDPWADERPEDEFADRKAAMELAIRAYLTALDAEREPVAWMWRTNWTGEKWHFAAEASFSPSDLERGIVHSVAPLYAAPLPLTDLEAENARLKARLAEALKALEKSENLFEAISHHIDEHSFSFAKGFCSQGAFTARRVREGGKVDG